MEPFQNGSCPFNISLGEPEISGQDEDLLIEPPAKAEPTKYFRRLRAIGS
jgi:hypothetical protein